ncbi:MAG: hypothetical protein DRH12_03735 [Deltaproteobacteria bacterium]|nr:MAG: hypothetical protein DRH12_03735 [Deltaproteobacteria bacterium]
MDIPQEWKEIDLSHLRGIIMVIGAPDVGKSTFSRFLFERLKGRGQCVAFLDGDPGQSKLGPPTTITLALNPDFSNPFSKKNDIWRAFIASVSPSRHMLPMLVGINKLLTIAEHIPVHTVVYDTTGLIDKEQGGVQFKQAKIELVRPSIIFAIQRSRELEPILTPFRKTGRTKIIDIKPSLAAIERSQYVRRRYRRLQFTSYFHGSVKKTLEWSSFGVFPKPFFSRFGLVAFENRQGLALSIGITMEIQTDQRKVTLMVPDIDLADVVALRIGNVMVDPLSFEDQRI